MRLIDADALKEKLDELEPYIDCDENSTAWIESDEVYNAIDNATPVPNEYMRGYEAAEREYKKPQGTWIPCKSTRTGQITNIDYKCSECFHHKDRPVPYCEICGAKMRKGDAE